MANAWIKLVTKTFNDNKRIRGYTFKNAIMDAKKVYKKESVVQSSTRKNRGSRKQRGSRKHRRSHRG